MKKVVKIIIATITIIIIVLLIFFLITFREKIELTDDIRFSGGNSFIKLSDGYTEYEIGGDPEGIPVVLIHGMTIAMYDWDLQFDFLVSLGYRVLRYNQYGRALSDRPSAVYNKEFYIKQLNEIIDSFFNKKVNIVSHSFGGGLAAEYALQYENKVDKLIFLAPSLNLEKENSGISLVKIPIIGDYCVLTILSPILAARAEGLFETSSVNVVNKYNEYFDLQTRISGFSSAVKSLFRNGAVGDYSDTFSKINGSKSLILWGTLDRTVPLEEIKTIEQLNREIEIKIFDSADHSLNFEIPDIINEEINLFLSSNQPF